MNYKNLSINPTIGIPFLDFYAGVGIGGIINRQIISNDDYLYATIGPTVPLDYPFEELGFMGRLAYKYKLLLLGVNIRSPGLDDTYIEVSAGIDFN